MVRYFTLRPLKPNRLESIGFALSWVAVGFAVLASAYWVRYVFFSNDNFLFDVAFTVTMGPLNFAVLVLAVIPCGMWYGRTGERRALASLLLSGCSFLIVFVETILLWTVIKTRGA